MLKILGLLTALVMVVATIGVGTWAYFSDVAQLTDNTITAGTLYMKIDSDTNLQEDGTYDAVLEVGPLYPGQTSSFTSILVENAGTMSGDLYARIGSVVDSGGTPAFPPGDPKASNRAEYLAEKALGGGTWAAVDDISTKIELFVTDGDDAAISGLDSEILDDLNDGAWVLLEEGIASAGTFTLKVAGKLPTTTDNEYQGDVSTFTIEFKIVQEGQTP